MAQTSILIINYYWPPCGGSAVQRWLDITRHFSDLGIKCYVITIDEKKATYWVRDYSLLTLIPDTLQTFRTDTSELFDFYKKYIGKGKIPKSGLSDEPNPTFLQKVARFIRGNFFLPDPRRGWNKHAIKKANKIISKYHISKIITAGPPHSSHLIGLNLKRSSNIIWIADMHDYWTEISYLKKFYRTKLANVIDKWYERKILSKTDMIMTHCQSSKSLLIKKSKKTIENKIHVHTMGYDEQLFLKNKYSHKQTEFIITYTGLMPDYYAPDVFFDVLKKIKINYPDLPLKLRFVGFLSPEVKQTIQEFDLENNLDETGYVTHEQSIGYLYSSSILLLINPKYKNEKIHVPGKIYEYLAVCKPIISISTRDSENGEIIKKCQAGKNFSRDQDRAIYDYLEFLIKKWIKTQNLDIISSNALYKQYGRAYESKKLKSLIEKL